MSGLSQSSTLLSFVVLIVCLVGSGNGRSLSDTNTTATNMSLLNATGEPTIVLSEHDIKGNQYFAEDETMSHEMKEEEVEGKQKSKSSSKRSSWSWIAPTIAMSIILTGLIALVVRKHSHYGRPGPSRHRYQVVAPIDWMALPNYSSQEIIVVDVQPYQYYADPATMSHA
eukprot:m.89587 g.89587  ORF g.89587 m.89587 type:complete len:170 (-) comp26312_c0_seq1:289-798(-)